MNRSNNTSNPSGGNPSGGLYKRVTSSITGRLGAVAVVVVVLLTVSAVGVGSVASANAQSGNTTQSGENTESFAVKQGDNCYTITPIGNETDNVASFYNYRSHGSGYSSRGTTDLQVEDTSQFFFYKGNGGLSLVMLHDQWTGNASNTGGAVTLEMDGLPVTGGWAVKDDGYPGSGDSFTFNESTATASWSWGGGRADGGVYQAPPSAWDSKVKITPKFNREAANYPNPSWEGGDTAHQVQRWIVRSGDGKAHPLNLYDEVTIEKGTCADVGGSSQNNSTAGGSASTGQDTGNGAEMTTSGDSEGTAATGPGFGIGLTVLALAVALVAILRRR